MFSGVFAGALILREDMVTFVEQIIVSNSDGKLRTLRS